jgi:hypothetical protein
MSRDLDNVRPLYRRLVDDLGVDLEVPRRQVQLAWSFVVDL